MSSPSLRILEHLAIESPEGATGYEIYLDLRPRLSRSTVYDHLGRLKQKGLIREGESGKIPTILGLTQLLKFSCFHKCGGELLLWLDRLMQTQREFLAPISSKWERFKHFEREGVMNLLAFLVCSPLEFFPVEDMRNLTKEGEAKLQERILDEVFNPSISGADDLPMRLRRRWFEVMTSDPDLLEQLIRRARRREDFSRNRLFRDQFIRRALEEKNLGNLFLVKGSSGAFVHPLLAKNCSLPLLRKVMPRFEAVSKWAEEGEKEVRGKVRERRRRKRFG